MTDKPIKTGRKTDGTFASGNLANPSGRPKGSRNKTTLAVQSLLEGEAEAISRKAVELAKAGDMTAIRLVLERVLPPRKDAPVTLDMPILEKADDAARAMALVLQAVGTGELTPAEGQAVTSLIETWRKTLETAELEQRITALEGRHGKSQ